MNRLNITRDIVESPLGGFKWGLNYKATVFKKCKSVPILDAADIFIIDLFPSIAVVDGEEEGTASFYLQWVPLNDSDIKHVQKKLANDEPAKGIAKSYDVNIMKVVYDILNDACDKDDVEGFVYMFMTRIGLNPLTIMDSIVVNSIIDNAACDNAILVGDMCVDQPASTHAILEQVATSTAKEVAIIMNEICTDFGEIYDKYFKEDIENEQ